MDEDEITVGNVKLQVVDIPSKYTWDKVRKYVYIAVGIIILITFFIFLSVSTWISITT